MATYETLRIEPAPGTAPDEGVRCLMLNRPEVMNAMNTQMFVELRAALHELAFDDGLRVLVVTGAGERAFSTGGDLKQRDGMTDHQWRRQHQLAEEVLLAVKDFPAPVIAAVEGHTHGGGCELALMCDWIVAARSAVFSLPEVRRGIMPGGGGIQNLVRAAGARRAVEHRDHARRARPGAGRRRGRGTRGDAGGADGGALRQGGGLARW
jgi:enoyl-CoA hydratase